MSEKCPLLWTAASELLKPPVSLARQAIISSFFSKYLFLKSGNVKEMIDCSPESAGKFQDRSGFPE